MKKLIPLIMITSLLTGGTSVAADSPEKFLAGLNGEYRGRGEAIVEISNSQERVSCKLENDFNSEEQVLNIVGVCATTQGKANVDGKLSMVDGKVFGSFLSPFKNSEITQEASNYNDGTLTISTSFVNKDTGNLSRMRQIVVSNPEGGFNSTFQKFDNSAGAYKDTGFVEFSPTGN